MTVDKPPLALWVQALSARAFGFNSWSMLVPQALMGVGDRRAHLRHDAPALRPRCRLRRRAGTGDHPGGRRDLPATTTPTRCSCCAAPPRCGSWCAGWRMGGRGGSSLRASPSASASRRRWRRRCSWCRRWSPRDLWFAPRGRAAAVRSLAAGGAAMAAVGLAWPLLIWLTPGRRPAVGLGHERQQHLVADLRLQRPRPALRPGRRPGWRRRAGRRWRRRRVRRRARGHAAVQRGARRPGRLAARCPPSRPGSACSSSRGCAAPMPAPAGCLAVGGVGLTMAVAFSRAEGIFHPTTSPQPRR